MRRSSQEALTFRDHAEAIGGTFARQIPTMTVVALGCVLVASRVSQLAAARGESVSLIPFFLPVLGFSVLIPLLVAPAYALATKRPPGGLRDHIRRVAYVVSPDHGIGGLWIGRGELHVVTTRVHETISFSSVRRVWVDDPGSFLTMIRWDRRGYPLVIERHDGPALRLRVLAPVSMARSIREALAEAGGRA